VRCAVAVQQAMPEHNLGDVIVEGDDLYGDGVNIAARIEALADPGGVLVSGTVYDHVRDRLPFLFEDLGEHRVKNIARPLRVYRIALTHLAPARQARGLAADEAPGSPLSRTAGEGAERQRREAGEGSAALLPLPDKPSIAVLPFANLSGDPEQDYFVDGMVEEITTAIARLPRLFVIARNSSFAYKGKSPDLREVGRELGVRYVLEGSVRKADNRVRIAGQLIDTATGAHIWADRFDAQLDDIFELQDEVASSVVGAIEPKLRQSEIERAARKPTESLDAYDLYLRALAEFHKYPKSSVRQAIELSRRALAIDPAYALAAALIGWCLQAQSVEGWVPSSEVDAAEASGWRSRRSRPARTTRMPWPWLPVPSRGSPVTTARPLVRSTAP
jgi:adenylate cyclase